MITLSKADYMRLPKERLAELLIERDELEELQMIEKACEWLKENVTFKNPRTGETKCVVNLQNFKQAMKDE